eukprot:2853987-Amphidinium_carterae.1
MLRFKLEAGPFSSAPLHFGKATTFEAEPHSASLRPMTITQELETDKSRSVYPLFHWDGLRKHRLPVAQICGVAIFRLRKPPQFFHRRAQRNASHQSESPSNTGKTEADWPGGRWGVPGA